MLFQHRVGGDEFRVFHHLVFGDGPAVVIPGVPAIFRLLGEIVFHLGIILGVALQDLQSVPALDRDRIEFDMSGRIQMEQLEIDPPAGHFPAFGRTAEIIVVMLRQRG